VDQAGLVEEGQAVQKLLGKDAHEGGAEAAELVLLDELVQIDAEQLENQTKMLSMDKRIFQSQKMVVVVLVELGVELCRVSASGNE
jgi:hypothetical protein